MFRYAACSPSALHYVAACYPCRCGDAMELSLPAGSCDVAFSNWLLMYLGDAEVQQLARNMLSWVRPHALLDLAGLLAAVAALALLCGCASERCGGAAAGAQHALLGAWCMSWYLSSGLRL